jgi:DNA-binding IscR family transcriptional regulator
MHGGRGGYTLIMPPLEIRFGEIIYVDEGWLTGTHLMCYPVNLDMLMTHYPKPQTSFIIRNDNKQVFLANLLMNHLKEYQDDATKMARRATDTSGCY